MALKSLIDKDISNNMDSSIEPTFDNTADEPIRPRRGRPSKTAPVYDENGVMLLSSEQRERINELVTGIRTDGEKVHKLLISAAQKHFQLGEILCDVERKSVGKMTVAKYEEITGIPSRLVSTAMKVYKHFANNPEALDGLSMRDVAMLICEKKEDAGKTATHVQYSLPSNDDNAELINESFGLPTLSGVSLNNYRLHGDKKSGTLYLLGRGTTAAIPIASLTVGQPQDATAEDAYNDLMNGVQEALERYYSVLEQNEDV